MRSKVKFRKLSSNDYSGFEQLFAIKDTIGATFLNKRQKIIIASVLISFGLLTTHTATFFFLRTQFILGLGIFAYVLSLWALWEGMTKTKAIILLILPTMFTVAVASFYFLLPVRWLTRIPFVMLFAFSFYSLLLSQNVFNVAANRTIPLYRAASTVSFLFTLVTAFFLYNVVFAVNMPFYWNGLVVGVVSFPLIVQLLWSLKMEESNITLISYSFILALILGEGALALSFWPVAPTVWSMTLSTAAYVLLGIVTESMRDKLGKRVVVEYVTVGVIVLIFAFLSTSWGA